MSLDEIMKKYRFDADYIADIIYMFANSENERDFVQQFVNKFEIEEDDVFSERDLVTLYQELSDSKDVKDMINDIKRQQNIHFERKSRFSRKPVRKFENKQTLKESYGSFKEGDTVIVTDKNDTGIALGQIITIDKVEGNYVLFTKGGKQYGIPKSCVKSLNESKKNGTSLEKTMTGQYIEMIKEGKSHKAVIEGIARKYGMNIIDTENTINKCLGVAGMNRKRFDESKKIIKENEIEISEAEEEYEDIADKVLVYMLRNSDDYRKLYTTIDDAVVATLTFLKLSDEIGEEGTKKIVEIIKSKYVDDKNVYDDFDEEESEEFEKVEESRVDRNIVECIKKNVGYPVYWGMNKDHFIAGFSDKIFSEESIRNLREHTFFDYISENKDYSLIYIKK